MDDANVFAVVVVVTGDVVVSNGDVIVSTSDVIVSTVDVFWVAFLVVDFFEIVVVFIGNRTKG